MDAQYLDLCSAFCTIILLHHCSSYRVPSKFRIPALNFLTPPLVRVTTMVRRRGRHRMQGLIYKYGQILLGHSDQFGRLYKAMQRSIVALRRIIKRHINLNNDEDMFENTSLCRIALDFTADCGINIATCRRAWLMRRSFLPSPRRFAVVAVLVASFTHHIYLAWTRQTVNSP